MADWEAIQDGRSRGPAAALARAALAAASGGYRLGRMGHRALYRSGLCRRVRLPVPVLSVGNLTAGGVGKTPVVAWLAGLLREEGWQPAILARGYGRRPGEVLNEEGRWLEARLPGVPVLQDPDRAGAARAFLTRASCDVFVLDDGFQHERLERDLDLVLIDATRPFGFGHLLPRGLLREPAAALARAQFVGITRVELASGAALDALRSSLNRLAPGAVHGALRFQVTLRQGEEVHPVAALRGRRVLVAAAVGNPESVRRTVLGCGAEIAAERFLPDHHPLPGSVWCELRDRAEQLGAELVITEKDAVKHATSAALGAPPPWVLVQELSFDEGERELLQLVEQVMEERPRPAPKGRPC